MQLHTTTTRQHTPRGRSRRRAGTAALGSSLALVVALAGCGQSGDEVGEDAVDTATTASASSEPAAAEPTTAEPTTSEPETTTDTGSSDESDAATADLRAAAEQYLDDRAAGDADAAWEALSASSQQAWPDRGTFDALVQEQAEGYAALLDADPTVVATPGPGGDEGGVLTVHGVVDPAGSPRVGALTVVLESGLNVLEVPDDAQPAFEWINPGLAGAGSLGVAEFTPEAALAFRLGAGATTATVAVDGTAVGGDPSTAPQDDGSTVVTLAPPTIQPGTHVVTVVYGYPGEPMAAQAVVVDTDQP